MEMLQIFKALGDDTRLRLLHILFKNELSVNELVQILNMGQSRVSRHLKILTEAGLLTFRRDGLWVFYSAANKGRGAEFLKAVMPLFPPNAIMSADLEKAAQKLEERAQKTRQFFNTIAESWDDLNHDILGAFDLPGAVTQALPNPCKTAVDLGCGTGEVLKSLLTGAEKVIGVDGSARMLDLSRQRLDGYEKNGSLSLRIGELHHLPLADAEVDFACINLVLHHLPQPLEIIRELKRILAPGAKLFIADFMRHSDETMRSRYGDQWLGLDSEEICASLSANDFEIQNCRLQCVNRDLSLFMVEARKRLTGGH